MGSTVGRPMGVTLVAVVVILMGALAVLVGLNLSGAVELYAVPAAGARGVTGAGMLLVGILNVVIGVGLFSGTYWAYVIALVVLVLTIMAGFLALIQHGVTGENLPSLVPALVAAVVFAYLLSDDARPWFD